MIQENPLVSIVVITYNSSKYVLETLESTKAQTYRNIELIISDDCSTDNTVALCRDWLENNSERFVRVELVTAEVNTGVAANCNRGYKKAKGEWIKGIAGDDILLEKCVEENVQFARINSDANIVFSKMVAFGDEGIISTNEKIFIFGYKALALPRKDLLYLLLMRNFLPASTAFIKHSIYDELEGFEESIPLLEDWPFWIKAAYNHACFKLFERETVKYRMSESSISMGTRSQRYSDSCKLARNFADEYCRKTNILLWLYLMLGRWVSNKNILLRIIIRGLQMMNPMAWHMKCLQRKLS